MMFKSLLFKRLHMHFKARHGEARNRLVKKAAVRRAQAWTRRTRLVNGTRVEQIKQAK